MTDDLISREAALECCNEMLRKSKPLEKSTSAIELRRAIAALPAAQVQTEPVAFQSRVKPWFLACFGAEISSDRLERGDRLLEEVFELLQSGDYPQDRVAALSSYVWSRPAGEPAQEVGGVMVTLAAYCLAHGLDMHAAGETELARVWTKVEKIRAKQAAKPTGSALPQAWPATQPAPDDLDALVQRLQKLGRDMDRHAAPDWDENEDVFAAVNAITALRAALVASEPAPGSHQPPLPSSDAQGGEV